MIIDRIEHDATSCYSTAKTRATNHLRPQRESPLGGRRGWRLKCARVDGRLGMNDKIDLESKRFPHKVNSDHMGASLRSTYGKIEYSSCFQAGTQSGDGM